jgi:hypothetical protein
MLTCALNAMRVMKVTNFKIILLVFVTASHRGMTLPVLGYLSSLYSSLLGILSLPYLTLWAITGLIITKNSNPFVSPCLNDLLLI